METKQLPKITKSALNKIIQWSTSRYNYYLMLGTKKEAVERIHYALLNGSDKDTGKVLFEIECATGNGEGYGNRYWKLKGKGSDWKYTVDAALKRITCHPSGNIFQFTSNQPQKAS